MAGESLHQIADKERGWGGDGREAVAGVESEKSAKRTEGRSTATTHNRRSQTTRKQRESNSSESHSLQMSMVADHVMNRDASRRRETLNDGIRMVTSSRV